MAIGALMDGVEIVQPVILCGGSGSRLWPLSRSGFPKQFLCLTGSQSLFQSSAMRMLGCVDGADCTPYVVCNEEHRFVAQEQLRELGVGRAEYLLEPAGRNTAPALTLAALAALEGGRDPILIVAPADQSIADDAAFKVSIRQAVEVARTGSIVILGVAPDKPETGYGYIKVVDGESRVTMVQRFVEKPTQEVAQAYLDEGGYFWNAGLFVLKASVWLAALNTFRPDIADATSAAWDGRDSDASFIRPDRALFELIPEDSIDYAVIEKCPESAFQIKMLPLEGGWSDLGAWDAVWNISCKDEDGNFVEGDAILTESRNCYVRADSRLVALVGVEDLIVVETPDAILVADKARSQEVKKIVNRLDGDSREEHAVHRKVHRPWGWYDCIDQGVRFKVKRIQVNPKASLSLQKHHHRAEHWIVVQGTAEITRGSETLLLSENQSTYISLGEVHRLSNPGSIPLEIIEVQSGSYLGEDDIVRLDDQYGRGC